MKAISLNTQIKNIFLGIFILMIIFSFNSCAKKVTFLTSSVVPAARGYVKVKKNHNKNYSIQIQLLYLAEAKRLQPEKQNYVVWMVSDHELTINIGQINSSISQLSKKLKGSFETVTVFKPTQIFISAENEVSVQYPKGQVVLSTENFKIKH